MNNEDLNHKKSVQEILKRRLRERELQEAAGGINTDPVIKIEIEDLKKRIQEIENEITGEPEATSTDRSYIHASQTILNLLEITYSAFVAQCRVRDKIEEMLYNRLKIREVYEYEELFSRYYEQMTPEERHFHNSIRSYTENTLYVYNSQILETIKLYPELEEYVPSMKSLKQHLILWISKYHGLFQNTPHMCLVYVGVEEKFPFPKTIQREIELFLQRTKRTER